MSWRNRVPPKIPSGISSEDSPAKIWTSLEAMLMKVCQQTNLTSSQRDTLDKDPIFIDQDLDPVKMPDPNYMYDNSLLFKAFANEKARLMRSNGASVGKIITAIANYIHPHGWLVYLEKNSPLEPERSEKKNTILGGSIEKK